MRKLFLLVPLLLVACDPIPSGLDDLGEYTEFILEGLHPNTVDCDVSSLEVGSDEVGNCWAKDVFGTLIEFAPGVAPLRWATSNPKAIVINQVGVIVPGTVADASVGIIAFGPKGSRAEFFISSDDPPTPAQ